MLLLLEENNNKFTRDTVGLKNIGLKMKRRLRLNNPTSAGFS